MKKIVNWAHRGASGHAPENTLAAFQRALVMGADGIECDVRESRDGELVVFHDPTIKRLTGKVGRLQDLTSSEIKKLDVGSWFSPSFKGEAVPTLVEAIERVPPPFLLNLEIKSASPVKIVELIHEREISGRVVVSSFNHPLLAQIRKLDPALPLGFLVDREPWKTVFREALKLNVVSLNVSAKRIAPYRIDQAHKEGLEVHLFTVNQVDQMALFIQMGVDGLFTNYPDLLARLRAEML